MKRVVLSVASLLLAGAPGVRGEAEPARLERTASENRIHAQRLIEDVMARNPDLVGIGLHAIPPHATDYEIIAQLRDIIGRKSSEDDLEIIKQDATRINPDMLGAIPRMKALAPLRDRGGQIIGLAALSFKRPPGLTKLAVHARLDAILAGLAQEIPGRESLFEPAP
ncbi:MAG: hypothetical protein JWM35_1050 [Verrucomicrobia bacterium]|nr:hypothetical protein [Verrucomicrobiota bacterium]